MIVTYRNPGAGFVATLLATSRAYLQRSSAYLIALIRWPLGPLFTFATWRVTYHAAGNGSVEGATVSGFLLVGVFGLITWTSSIWASGYAVEYERGEGTSASLFLTPASRAAVVAGYGLGSFVWFLPCFIMVTLLGVATGATLNIGSMAAAALGALAMVTASLSMGFTLAGLFILSRRGNLIANVMQPPLLLLGGFAVPIARLPLSVRWISNGLPITHALEAFRPAVLTGAGLATTGRELALSFGVSAAYVVAGLLALRRVEHVARRLGQLDLY